MDKVNGLSGLRNMGNTCYLNSVIQSLSSCEVFVNYLFKFKYQDGLKYNMALLLSKKIRNDNNLDNDTLIKLDKDNLDKLCNNTITVKLHELINGIYEDNSIIVPKSFKNIMGKLNNIFIGTDQNDCHETLMFIFDRIHEETKLDEQTYFSSTMDISELIELKKICKEIAISLKNNSINNDIYQNYKRYIYNNFDKYIEYKYRKFWTRYIKNNSSIITQSFTGTICVCVKCSKCNYRSLSYEPYNILNLSLTNNSNVTLKECIENNYSIKEVLNNENQYKCKKCDILVDATKIQTIHELPKILIIQFKRFGLENGRLIKNTCVVEYNEDISIKTKKFKLFSVIEHCGTINFGHYTAICRNIFNKEWYLFDDDKILKLNNYFPKQPYLLFYKME